MLDLCESLHSVEDFHHLSCTCKTLQIQLLAATPNTILRLAARSESSFFRLRPNQYKPVPYLIMAATSRQLSDWATQSPENVERLRLAFRGGIAPFDMDDEEDSDDEDEPIKSPTANILTLLDLCLEHCGLTMDDIRRLHSYKKSTIDPVIDFFDKCSGQQWLDTPGFSDGAVSDPEDREPGSFNMPETFYSLAIYGSLFASSFDAYLDPKVGVNKSMLDIEARLDYLKYCVSDDSCWFTQHRSTDAPRNPEGPGRLHSWMVVELSPVYDDMDWYEVKTEPQAVLRHLLRGSGWNKMWKSVRVTAGGDLEEPWRQRLWEAVVMFQGFEGMEMIGGLGPEEWRARLMEWRKKIEVLQEEPRIIMVGRRRHLKVFTPEYPWLRSELQICTYGHYGSYDREETDGGFDVDGGYI